MFMITPEFNIAFEKARLITDILARRTRKDVFVALDDIIEAVKEVSGFSDVIVQRQSFSGLSMPINDPAPTFGAMLSTMTRTSSTNGNKERVALLIVNSDNNANMQRFSVAHELGHLITDIPNFTYEKTDDDRFTISAHVNPDITFIPESDCINNNYLIAEQVANIFALLVLIPRDIKIRDLKEIGIKKLTEDYGVTEDAVFSRMLLSSVKAPEIQKNAGAT